MTARPPHRDPLSLQIAKTRLVLWACVLVVLGAISVRWWPMDDGEREPGDLASTSLDDNAASPERRRGGVAASSHDDRDPTPLSPNARLDLAAFDRAMWLVPAATEPAKVAAEKPAPPPPPLTLQLLGLVSEGGTTKAVLYDSTADRVRVVGVGDSIGDRKVERIDARGVAIRDGAGVRTLALKGGGSP